MSDDALWTEFWHCFICLSGSALCVSAGGMWYCWLLALTLGIVFHGHIPLSIPPSLPPLQPGYGGLDDDDDLPPPSSSMLYIYIYIHIYIYIYIYIL